MKKNRDFIWDTGWSLTRFSRLVHQVSGKLPSAPGWAGETAHPPMDIFEDETGIHVELEVPGIKREELSIRLDRDKLIIEGYKHGEGDIECLRYICLEREFGVFRRIVEIPVSLDTSGVQAALVEGILKINLPKVKERRKAVIEVPIDV